MIYERKDLVELIYLYIRKYEEVFENEEFNYYGKNVNNVVMFLGKNGMGKSTLLDILGMNRDDRIADTYHRRII